MARKMLPSLIFLCDGGLSVHRVHRSCSPAPLTTLNLQAVKKVQACIRAWLKRTEPSRKLLAGLSKPRSTRKVFPAVACVQRAWRVYSAKKEIEMRYTKELRTNVGHGPRGGWRHLVSPRIVAECPRSSSP